MTYIIQRPLKGSRISSFYPVKSLPPISTLESAFQLQEYISLLIRLDVHDVDTIVTIPGKQGSKEREGSDDSKGDEKDSEKDSKGEVTVDEACWIYEQLRRLAQDLSHPLITMLQQECTRQTCPEMKAGEWLYLCVAHGNDGAMEQCCAIDYILHTLDSATALLNSPRAFPSRLSIPATSHRHFASLARRLGRIFAHAYFHHREAFEQAEAESSLYARFLALTSKYDLVPAEFLVIPLRQHDERDINAEIDPRRFLGVDSNNNRGDHDIDRRQWNLGESSSMVDLGAGTGSGTVGRGSSPPGPAGITRTDSPRKFGRSRTDTMVYSEAANVVEELAKSNGSGPSDTELNRAIREESVSGAVDNVLPGSINLINPPIVKSQAPSTTTEVEPAPVTVPSQAPPTSIPVSEAPIILEIPAPAPAEPPIPISSDELEANPLSSSPVETTAPDKKEAEEPLSQATPSEPVASETAPSVDDSTPSQPDDTSNTTATLEEEEPPVTTEAVPTQLPEIKLEEATPSDVEAVSREKEMKTKDEDEDAETEAEEAETEAEEVEAQLATTAPEAESSSPSQTEETPSVPSLPPSSAAEEPKADPVTVLAPTSEEPSVTALEEAKEVIPEAQAEVEPVAQAEEPQVVSVKEAKKEETSSSSDIPPASSELTATPEISSAPETTEAPAEPEEKVVEKTEEKTESTAADVPVEDEKTVPAIVISGAS